MQSCSTQCRAGEIVEVLLMVLLTDRGGGSQWHVWDVQGGRTVGPEHCFINEANDIFMFMDIRNIL